MLTKDDVYNCCLDAQKTGVQHKNYRCLTLGKSDKEIDQ